MSINRLMEALPQSTDCALIVSPQNRRYFTDFDSSDGFLLVTPSDSVFFTDSRYLEAAERKITCCPVRDSRNVFAELRDFLNARGLCSIALEASGTSLAAFKRLRENEYLKGFDFVTDSSLDDAIAALREVKSPLEVQRIEAAQAIAEKAFCHILDFIKPGRTEREVQLELDYFMLRNGAEALSFDTIALSGVNGSMPHGVPSDKAIEPGDFVTMDFGAVVEGYHSDMTRTVAVGHVSLKQREVYDTVLKAQEAAINAICHGTAACEADKAARDIIAGAGYGEFFGHGTGHGVGVEIHESPSLSPKSKDILRKGNIVTAEPGIYIPGSFGVRIEDMLYITASGGQNLTHAEKSLIIL